ncbi:hypothetical protein D3C87_1949070 [compost metagenome]
MLSTSMDPLLGVSKPAIIRRMVVLPQPDGPSREMNSPLSKAKLTPLTTVVCPKVLTRFWTWRKAAMVSLSLRMCEGRSDRAR